MDIMGQPTSATYAVSMGESGFGIEGATGDDRLLMTDCFFEASGVPASITLFSITPGDYLFYLYGWATPLDGASGTSGQTTFDIGIPGGNSKTVVLDYEGPWPGMQVEGNTFAKVQVFIPDFATAIGIGLRPSGEGISIIQGMQMVPIPAPPAAAFTAILALACSTRRRC